MRLVLESDKKISLEKLPDIVDGNFWIESDSKNLLNIEAENNKWVMKSNAEVKICKNRDNSNATILDNIGSVVLEENNHYYIYDSITNKGYILYTLSNYEKMENFVIDYNKTKSIIIGKKNTDIIIMLIIIYIYMNI